jgi:hypothetical protein
MAGPTDAKFALVWVTDALDRGRYITTPHFEQRCAQRRYSIFDAKKVVQTATRCEPYLDHTCRAGGTGWRIFGHDSDGEPAMLGVEAYKDNMGRRVLLITIMDGA